MLLAVSLPATISAIADAIRWAEEIMLEIDRRWPVNGDVPRYIERDNLLLTTLLVMTEE